MSQEARSAASTLSHVSDVALETANEVRRATRRRPLEYGWPEGLRPVLRPAKEPSPAIRRAVQKAIRDARRGARRLRRV